MESRKIYLGTLIFERMLPFASRENIPELVDSLPENVDLCLYSTGYAKFIELSYGGYASFRGVRSC